MALAMTAQYEISRSESSGEMPSMHYHDSYELYFLEVGSREYFVEDALFSVAAGEFVLIAPGMLHRTGGQYGMRTLVAFTEAFLLRNYRPEAVKQLLACFGHLKLAPAEPLLSQCLQQLRMLFASETELDFSVHLGCLLRLLSRCESGAIAGSTVSDIVSYINRNYGTIVNISEISQRFYISKYHLCRIFKDAMKMTVVDYLNRVRIKNACRHLRTGRKSVTQIAQLCGFHDSAYFGNVFKKTMGVTPGSYRREHESQS